MENKNQPANPATIHKVKGEEVETVSFPGLSKREYFAGLAMQGMITRIKNEVKIETISEIPNNVAQWSILFADELLKQLEK